MVTIYDIAKQANVSAMTVSRVINNTGKISEKTREKVRAVMKELGYVPNMTARSLVVQKTNMLSLLIPDITNPFFTTVARGAEDSALKEGYRMLFGNSDESLDKESLYVDTVLRTRADGVLFAPAGDRSEQHLRQLQKHGIPFVLLDREVPGIEVDAVLGDSKAGARKLVEHLIEHGHRRIAMLGGASGVSTARSRLSGYLEALKLNGLPIDEALIGESGYTQFNNEALLDRLLSLPEPPTAVFAANNFVAVGLIRMLQARGLRVPEHLSVVCFDEIADPLQLDPFLTVAAQPAYLFGQLGIQLLLDRIEGRHTGTERRCVVLPPELRIRRSVRRCPQ